MTRAAALTAFLIGCSSNSISIGSSHAGSGGLSPSNNGQFTFGGSIGLGGSGGASAGQVSPSAGGSVSVAGGGIEPALGCSVQLASGDSHTCIFYEDGGIACLGNNAYGQLGEPIGMASLSPRTIPGVSATMLTAGGDHNCVLTSRGIECWGTDSTVEGVSAKPVLVFDQTELFRPMLHLVAGRQFTCGLGNDSPSPIICWRGGMGMSRSFHQVGDERGQFLVAGGGTLRVVGSDRLFDMPLSFELNDIGDPQAVPGATAGVASNSISSDHECILKRSGTVWCRGAGFFDFYTSVTELGSDLVEVKVGEGFTCARSITGQVRCLGVNDRAQLGSFQLTAKGGRNGIATPIDSGAVELSLGTAHACARMAGGTVRCWGTFANVELGEPTIVSMTSGCKLQPQQFWGTAEPESRPADEFADSALAYAQERCRIAGAGELRDDCVREETRVLNGCLQAIGAKDVAYSSCAGAALWAAASCAATSDGDVANVERCMPKLADCGEPPRAVGFCARPRLSCDPLSMVGGEVSADQVCDGSADCPNGFDEFNCAPDAETFRCADGTSLALSKITGEVTCGDGSGP